MTTTATPHASAPPSAGNHERVGGPVRKGWREGTLTRAKELESLCRWVLANTPDKPDKKHGVLAEAVFAHIEAAREAAKAARLDPRRRWHVFRHGPLLERAMSNLDAAEALILNFAPADYVLGQVPCVLRSVQCHLVATDPRRQALERLARRLGVKDADHPLVAAQEPGFDERKQIVDEERGTIVTALRGAKSAALREQVRLRSFGTVLAVTIAVMFLLAAGVALLGFWRPTMIPMCFAPEEAGEAVVVCPLGQSEPFSVSDHPDIDDRVAATASKYDLLVIELVGLVAAAVAAAAAVGGMSGSSERNLLPVGMALLKLPTGAVTAFLGLLLMRGRFVPGLSALDTPEQILAWALVFGYAQQAFTRLVDRQGHAVLDNIRGADRPTPSPTAR